MPLTVSLYFFFYLYRPAIPFLLLYALFIAFDPSPEKGARKIMWFRRLKLWTWMKEYFPMSLVKSAELGDRPVIFGYHPHGIIGLGAFVNFGTEANDFSTLFPKQDLRVLTLASNFRGPIWREILLTLGFASVSKRSVESILRKGGSCMIVVGGASEALHSFPGTYDLILKRRFGFIKLALKYGVDLVPVVAFGETDIWDQLPNPPGSLIYTIQKTIQKVMSVSPPIFFGRGIFQYDVGIVPHRRPVTTVVGKPVKVPKVEEPSDEVVRKYHEMYCRALIQTFDENKEKYAPDRKRDMKIIE